MSNPGYQVLTASGKRGLLADGKRALFDATGDCPECCSTPHCSVPVPGLAESVPFTGGGVDIPVPGFVAPTDGVTLIICQAGQTSINLTNLSFAPGATAADVAAILNAAMILIGHSAWWGNAGTSLTYSPMTSGLVWFGAESTANFTAGNILTALGLPILVNSYGDWTTTPRHGFCTDATVPDGPNTTWPALSEAAIEDAIAHPSASGTYIDWRLSLGEVDGAQQANNGLDVAGYLGIGCVSLSAICTIPLSVATTPTTATLTINETYVIPSYAGSTVTVTVNDTTLATTFEMRTTGSYALDVPVGLLNLTGNNIIEFSLAGPPTRPPVGWLDVSGGSVGWGTGIADITTSGFPGPTVCLVLS